MSAFASKREARESILTVRLTAEQDATLIAAAAAMGIESKAELVRRAIDAYLASNAKAQKAARKVAQK